MIALNPVNKPGGMANVINRELQYQKPKGARNDGRTRSNPMDHRNKPHFKQEKPNIHHALQTIKNHKIEWMQAMTSQE